MERMERAIVVKTITMAPTQNILDNDYSPNLGLVNADIGAKTFTFATPAGTSTPTTPTPQTTPGTSTPSSPAAPVG